jgi:hypothetical protein
MPTYTQNQAADLLPDGLYSFYVKNAEETTSTTGNPLIKLTLQVNGTFTIYDNLVFTENAFWKIDQFRLCTGEVLGKPGSNASLEADDCVQRRGQVSVGSDEFPKGSGRNRNIVMEYMNPKTSGPIPATPAPRQPDPDNIPF